MPTRIVAVGEMDAIDPEASAAAGGGNEGDGGAKDMTLEEVLAELRKLGAKPAQVAGEMGWELDELIAELDPKQHQVIGEMKTAVKELADVFGLGPDRPVKELVEAVKGARQAQVEAARARQVQLIEKVVGEMVVHEPARPLIKRLLSVPDGADEPAVKKAVGELVQQEDVRQLLSAAFKDTPITPVQTDQKKESKPAGLRPRRVAI